jgi:hypothetical protein
LYIDFHNLEKYVAPFFMTEVTRATMLMGYINKYKRNGPEAQEKLLSETQRHRSGGGGGWNPLHASRNTEEETTLFRVTTENS